MSELSAHTRKYLGVTRAPLKLDLEAGGGEETADDDVVVIDSAASSPCASQQSTAGSRDDDGDDDGDDDTELVAVFRDYDRKFSARDVRDFPAQRGMRCTPAGVWTGMWKHLPLEVCARIAAFWALARDVPARRWRGSGAWQIPADHTLVLARSSSVLRDALEGVYPDGFQQMLDVQELFGSREELVRLDLRDLKPAGPSPGACVELLREFVRRGWTDALYDACGPGPRGFAHSALIAGTDVVGPTQWNAAPMTEHTEQTLLEEAAENNRASVARVMFDRAYTERVPFRTVVEPDERKRRRLVRVLLNRAVEHASADFVQEVLRHAPDHLAYVFSRVAFHALKKRPGDDRYTTDVELLRCVPHMVPEELLPPAFEDGLFYECKPYERGEVPAFVAVFHLSVKHQLLDVARVLLQLNASRVARERLGTEVGAEQRPLVKDARSVYVRREWAANTFGRLVSYVVGSRRPNEELLQLLLSPDAKFSVRLTNMRMIETETCGRSARADFDALELGLVFEALRGVRRALLAQRRKTRYWGRVLRLVRDTRCAHIQRFRVFFTDKGLSQPGPRVLWDQVFSMAEARKEAEEGSDEGEAKRAKRG